jgi:hypothetical protein
MAVSHTPQLMKPPHNNYILPESLTCVLSRAPADSAKCVHNEEAPSLFPTSSFTDAELYEKLGKKR